jgi:hypothetical protein
LLCVVLGDPERFKFLREEQIEKSRRVGGEAVACFGSLFAMDLLDHVASIVAAT